MQIHGDGPLMDARLKGIAPAIARAQERITVRETVAQASGSTRSTAPGPPVPPPLPLARGGGQAGSRTNKN